MSETIIALGDVYENEEVPAWARSVVGRAIDDLHAAGDVERLRAAAMAIYEAGYWTCDRPVDAAALWTELRDALGREPGKSPKPLDSARVVDFPAQVWVRTETNYWNNPAGHTFIMGVASSLDAAIAACDEKNGAREEYAKAAPWDREKREKRVNYDGALVVYRVQPVPFAADTVSNVECLDIVRDRDYLLQIVRDYEARARRDDARLWAATEVLGAISTPDGDLRLPTTDAEMARLKTAFAAAKDVP